MSSRRLFIGLMAAPAVQHEVDRYRQTWTWSTGARLTPLPNLHLTIDFLGDVAPAHEERLTRALSRVGMLPFQLCLRTPTLWPKGLAIVEPEECPGLQQLHANIGLALDAADIVRDPRPWVPHVTIAREAHDSTVPATFANIPWLIDRFSLVWSRGQARAAYEVLASWPTVHA